LVGWYGSEFRRAKNYTQNWKKGKKFLCFDVLDVLFRGLKAFPVALASLMEA
jgi:hypothetical protein